MVNALNVKGLLSVPRTISPYISSAMTSVAVIVGGEGGESDRMPCILVNAT